MEKMYLARTHAANITLHLKTMLLEESEGVDAAVQELERSTLAVLDRARELREEYDKLGLKEHAAKISRELNMLEEWVNNISNLYEGGFVVDELERKHIQYINNYILGWNSLHDNQKNAFLRGLAAEKQKALRDLNIYVMAWRRNLEKAINDGRADIAAKYERGLDEFEKCRDKIEKLGETLR